MRAGRAISPMSELASESVSQRLRAGCCPPTYPASRRLSPTGASRAPQKDDLLAHPGPAQRHHRHADLAARSDGALLVRVGAQVQAVLQAARTR